MSVLTKLNQAQDAHHQQPLVVSEAELIAEYDAMRRAYAAAVADRNIESALLWSKRANDIARQMARIQDDVVTIEDCALLSHDQQNEIMHRASFTPVWR